MFIQRRNAAVTKSMTLILPMALLAACGTPDKSEVPAPKPAAFASPAEAYAARCSSCHQAYEPSSRTAAQWEHDLGRMKDRSGLDEQTAKDVLAWLQANAKK